MCITGEKARYIDPALWITLWNMWITLNGIAGKLDYMQEFMVLEHLFPGYITCLPNMDAGGGDCVPGMLLI